MASSAFESLPNDIQKILKASVVNPNKDNVRLIVNAAKGDRTLVAQALSVGVPLVIPTGETTSTILFSCARNNQPEMVALLLELGADPNVQCGPSASTPLHVAAYRNHVTVVQLLCAEMRTNPTILNSNGEYADSIIAKGDCVNAIQLCRTSYSNYCNAVTLKETIEKLRETISAKDANGEDTSTDATEVMKLTQEFSNLQLMLIANAQLIQTNGNLKSLLMQTKQEVGSMMKDSTKKTNEELKAEVAEVNDVREVAQVMKAATDVHTVEKPNNE